MNDRVTPNRLWAVETPKPKTPVAPKTQKTPTQRDIGAEMMEEFGLTPTRTAPTSRPQVRTESPSPVRTSADVKSQHTSAAVPSTATPTRTGAATSVRYTTEEINEMLSNGYISITRELWPFLPVGSHVRFFKKGAGSKHERFRPGGFIKKQYVTTDNKHILLMETVRNGNGAPGYITYPMALDDLDEIWKRYPEECFVEIHLITNSLQHKNKQINDLSARVTALEAALKNKK
jgi:hypothetical protein